VAELSTPTSVSTHELVMAVLRQLQDMHGGVVEEVDVAIGGGSITVRLPVEGIRGDQDSRTFPRSRNRLS
jgi:hypothetical protein